MVQIKVTASNGVNYIAENVVEDGDAVRYVKEYEKLLPKEKSFCGLVAKTVN